MKKKILIGVILVLLLALTGCVKSTSSAFIFDDNWDSHVIIQVFANEYQTGSEEIRDIAERIAFMMPNLNYTIDYGQQYIQFTLKETMKIDDISFITKEVLPDGNIKISVQLPTLVTAQDYQGNPTGIPMEVDIYLPGEVIESNSLEYDNNYVMQNTLKGKKRGRVTWGLNPSNLVSSKKLWVIIKPF